MNDLEIERLTQQAEQNSNPDAYFILGTSYYFGDGVERDLDKAYDFFELGAEHKDKRCFWGSVMEAMSEEDSDLTDKKLTKSLLQISMMAIKKSAKKGCKISQFISGIMLYKSSDSPKHRAKAVKYLEASAVQNYAPALCFLARRYLVGKELEKDIQKGKKYLQSACDQNYKEALEIAEALANAKKVLK